MCRKSDGDVVKFVNESAESTNISKWLCLVIGILGSSLLTYIKVKGVFESGNNAHLLVLISIVATAIAAVLSLIVLPRWQGVVGLFIAVVTAYFILFTRLYGLS